MFRREIILLWCFLLIFPTTKTDVPTNNADKKSLEHLKEVFIKATMNTLMKFSSFLKKLDIPYLGAANVMYYAKEIAKAIAYAPLFNGKEGIEEFLMEQISEIALPCSSNYCSDIWCSVSSIADVTADVSIQDQIITPDLTDQVVIRKANNLAGSVLWRLSRIREPDPEVMLLHANLSPKVSNRIFSFIQSLSKEIYNSQYMSEFYRESGLTGSTVSVMSSPVCGSRYFDFKISLIPEISSKMSDMYVKTKEIYSSYTNSSIDAMIIPSILSETFALKLLKQGFFENNDDSTETSHDIMKLMMVGITSSHMKVHAGNVGRNTISNLMM